MFRAEGKPGTAIELSGWHPDHSNSPRQIDYRNSPAFPTLATSFCPGTRISVFLPRTPISVLPRTPISRSRVVGLCCQTLSNARRSCLDRDHDALRSMDLIGASANRLTRYRTSPSLCSARRARDDQASVTRHALVFRQLPEALADWASAVMSFPVLARLMCRLWAIHRTRAGQGQLSVLTARPSRPAVDRQGRFMGSWGTGSEFG